MATNIETIIVGGSSGGGGGGGSLPEDSPLLISIADASNVTSVSATSTVAPIPYPIGATAADAQIVVPVAPSVGTPVFVTCTDSSLFEPYTSYLYHKLVLTPDIFTAGGLITVVSILSSTSMLVIFNPPGGPSALPSNGETVQVAYSIGTVNTTDGTFDVGTYQGAGMPTTITSISTDECIHVIARVTGTGLTATGLSSSLVLLYGIIGINIAPEFEPLIGNPSAIKEIAANTFDVEYIFRWPAAEYNGLSGILNFTPFIVSASGAVKIVAISAYTTKDTTPGLTDPLAFKRLPVTPVLSKSPADADKAQFVITNYYPNNWHTQDIAQFIRSTEWQIATDTNFDSASLIGIHAKFSQVPNCYSILQNIAQEGWTWLSGSAPADATSLYIRARIVSENGTPSLWSTPVAFDFYSTSKWIGVNIDNLETMFTDGFVTVSIVPNGFVTDSLVSIPLSVYQKTANWEDGAQELAYFTANISAGNTSTSVEIRDIFPYYELDGGIPLEIAITQSSTAFSDGVYTNGEYVPVSLGGNAVVNHVSKDWIKPDPLVTIESPFTIGSGTYFPDSTWHNKLVVVNNYGSPTDLYFAEGPAMVPGLKFRVIQNQGNGIVRFNVSEVPGPGVSNVQMVTTFGVFGEGANPVKITEQYGSVEVTITDNISVVIYGDAQESIP